jgi:hypothetical protein
MIITISLSISLLISIFCLYRIYQFKKTPSKIGSLGFQGKIGPIGNRGIQGYKGKKGPKGYIGLPGDYGGIQGYSGVRGKRGNRGVDGINGFEGLKGLRGPPGPPGKAGMKGPKGPVGFRGPRGDISVYDFTVIDYDNCETILYNKTYDEVECVKDKALVELIPTDIGFNAKCCGMKLNDKCTIRQKNVKSVKTDPKTGKEKKEWNWLCPTNYYKVFKGTNKDRNRYCCKK